MNATRVTLAVVLALIVWPNPATAPEWWLGGVSTAYPDAGPAPIWYHPGPIPLTLPGDYLETDFFKTSDQP